MRWFRRKPKATPSDVGTHVGAAIVNAVNQLIESEVGWAGIKAMVNPALSRDQFAESLLAFCEFLGQMFLRHAADERLAAQVQAAADLFVETALKTGNTPIAPEKVTSYYDCRFSRMQRYWSAWRQYEESVKCEPGDHFRALAPLLQTICEEVQVKGDENIRATAAGVFFGIVSGIAEDVYKVLAQYDLGQFGSVRPENLLPLVQDFRITMEVVRRLAQEYRRGTPG